MWFTNFNDNDHALQNYATIFEQISNEAVEYTDIDYEQWYN